MSDGRTGKEGGVFQFHSLFWEGQVAQDPLFWGPRTNLSGIPGTLSYLLTNNKGVYSDSARWSS